MSWARSPCIYILFIISIISLWEVRLSSFELFSPFVQQQLECDNSTSKDPIKSPKMPPTDVLFRSSERKRERA